MPRIHPVSREAASPELLQIYDEVKSKIGILPNLFTTFGQSPAVIKAYLAMGDALGTGRLTAAQREIVALSVGQANKCQYCLSAHTLMGKGAGLSAAEMHDARQGKATNPLDNALADLAQKLTLQRGDLSDADLSSARAAGVDDGLMMEVIANVALNTLTNYTNHMAQTTVDFPIVTI